MSEQNAANGVTAADIKKQINEAKKQIEDSGMPITGQLANEINASQESTTNIAPVKAEVKTEPETTASKKVETLTAEEAGALDWAKKKGIVWSTDPKVLLGLHKSDQDFHKWRAENKDAEIPRPQVYQQPAYNPPAPVYVPPVVQNRQMLDNLARDYNMPAEDVERLLKFNKDFYEAASRADRERQNYEFESIKKEQQKQSVLRELSSDSVLKNPEVAVEFQRIIQEKQSIDPQSFERDPNEYLNARDKALNNIARRNLEGTQLQEGVPPRARMIIPSTPPRPLGQGSGDGALENERGIDSQQFAKLSLAEKSALLEKMGLRPSY